MKKVVKAKKEVDIYDGGTRFRETIQWWCTLSCGHVEIRQQPDRPVRLKCHVCEPW